MLLQAHEKQMATAIPGCRWWFACNNLKYIGKPPCNTLIKFLSCNAIGSYKIGYAIQTCVSVVPNAAGNVVDVETPANVKVAVDVLDVKLFANVQVPVRVDVTALVRPTANVNRDAPASDIKTITSRSIYM
ncbi:Hypothetical predicted protein [Mytilus galloprovincialis]|uniref:Uncharacterized protein n=1 Tax=Mytilus galloprovincialis TaxID=29158 RepID=A0A8B6GP85_MYTGA|nr:Hypothetical predicted protein [Mytilus galloprovincialis]